MVMDTNQTHGDILQYIHFLTHHVIKLKLIAVCQKETKVQALKDPV